MTFSAPRTFLLTVYPTGSVVLEDLATGQRENVPDLARLGEHDLLQYDGGRAQGSAARPRDAGAPARH